MPTSLLQHPDTRRARESIFCRIGDELKPTTIKNNRYDSLDESIN
jgi:hypothetical protein